MHGGEIYSVKVKYDFSVNTNPFVSKWTLWKLYLKFFNTINVYPDINSKELKESISARYKIESSRIITGNGASEILMAMVKAINPKKALLLCPSFSGYEYALNSAGSKIIYLPLDAKEDFELTEDKLNSLKELIEKEKPELLFLCNPNNPNGKLLSRQVIRKILGCTQKNRTTVLLDECFMDLTGKAKDFSLVSEIDDYSNLVILNAMTKTFAIPGLRLGFCFCSSIELTEKIQSQLPEWNISSLAQKIGASLLVNERFISKNIKKINTERTYLLNELSASGIKTFSTNSNFILFHTESKTNLKEKLLKYKILIRNCSDYKNLPAGFYRIAVRTHKENKLLIQSLKKILKEK